MSINLYLKKNWQNNSEASRLTLKSDGVGRTFIALPSGETSIPSIVAEMVEEISLFEEIAPARFFRELGIYKLEGVKDVEAEVDFTPNSAFYRIRIRGKKMEDIIGLFRAIKVGSIRPDESYEAPQGGKSRQQLEAELTATQQQLSGAQSDLSRLERRVSSLVVEAKELSKALNIASGKNCAIRQIANKLTKRFWSLVDGREVAHQINTILDGK